MIDCHVHLVDFRQRLLPQQDLQEAMDDAGATHAVVFGLPVRQRGTAVVLLSRSSGPHSSQRMAVDNSRP